MKCDHGDCQKEATRFDYIEVPDAPVDLETAYCDECHALRFKDETVKPVKNQHRGNPIFDRFFSQIIKAIQQEDGSEAYEIFIRALEKAAEGKGKL